MKLTELVKKLIAKAGITYEGEITDELPDDISTALDNGLLTLAAATNNHPLVKKVYFAQAYNGLDAELNDLINEYGLTDETKAEIERAGGSTKRATALIRKVKELGEKAATTPDAAKTTALNQQITDLNKKLAEEISKQTNLESKYNNDLKQIKVQTKLSGLLSNYKTVYDDLPIEAKEAAVNSLLSKSLQDSDADFTFDEKGNLSLIKKDGTNLFGDNHTLVTPQSFIDKTLSKILKVTEPPKPGNSFTPPAAVNGSQNQTNTALSAAIGESMQQYEAASKSAIAV